MMGMLVLGVLVLAPSAQCSSVIDITAYGADGNDLSDDTAAIQAAVAALSPNGVLLIPRSPGAFLYQIGAANFEINQPGVRIVVQGHLLGTGLPVSGNHVFIIAADDCAIIGEGGVLEGSGQYILGPDIENGPALIRAFNVQRCTVDELTLRNGPHFSVWLGAAGQCTIRRCFLEGGPIENDIQIHGIFLRGTSDILIEGNRFMANSQGGRAGSWIGSTSTSDNVDVRILNNHFGDRHDHAVYCSGLFWSQVSNNVVRGEGTSAIKTVGTHNIVVQNSIDMQGNNGGIECRNGSNCVVAHNIINNYGFVGIQISKYGSFVGAGMDNLIEGNVLTADHNAPYVYEGIRVMLPGAVSRCRIANNTIVGAGLSNKPAITVYGGAASDAVAICGNTLAQCQADGISVTNVNCSLISENIIDVLPSETAIQQNNVVTPNLVKGNLLTEFCGGCGAADLVEDGKVDLADLATFSQCWLSGVN